MKNFIQLIGDKITFSKSEEKTVFSDLMPVDTIKNDEESLKALHWALKNKKIKNIALTGPYGAGKSSVIESYLKQNKECKAINISLATFDGHSWDKAYESQEADNNNELEKLEDELEKGILKQLFYKVDASKIPLSRYRKLHHTPLWKYVFGIVTFVVVILAALYLAIPDKVSDYINAYKNEIDTFREWALIAISFLIVFFGAAYALRVITSRFTIKEISVGDISAQGEETPNDSVLNKNIDEMLYFFERTKHNVVFIEDLDRFNCTSIFVKLREINTILNNYDVIKKKGRIIFVYAVRDDLFKEETERTKFFDFLIPIIPVINSTNSGEIIRNLLGIGKEKDTKKEYPEHDISSEFITLISPYIGDMRILISTINEFWIYKRTLKESQDVKLKDENMLALMIYKNLYPQDFAQLEGEKGRIKEAFNYKKEAIKKVQTKLEEKRYRLELAQKDIVNSVKEIKILILSELVDNEGFVTSIYVSGSSIYYAQILEDSYSLEDLRIKPIQVSYRKNNSNYSKNHTNIEISTDKLKNLFKRYDLQCEFSDKNADELKCEYEKIDRDILALRANTMQSLIEKNSVEGILPDSVRENNLLVFMLRHGYINESYADYINYFHEGSITKEELNFILSVRDFKGENDFELSIKHCANTVKRLYDYEFKQVEILNFDLTDFLLYSEKNESKLEKLIQQLANRTDTCRRFIKSYIDRNKNTDRFLQKLCHTSGFVWKDIEADEQLSEEKKVLYLKKIINSCEIDDIANNDYETANGDVGGLRAYLEKNALILEKLSEVSNVKLKKVIAKLNANFYALHLEGVDREIVDFILEGRYFVLNHSMMEAIFAILNPSVGDRLFRCNYHCLHELNNRSLMNFIYDEFPSYVKIFIIGEESNTEESLMDVEDILERLFENNMEMCIDVIKKEHFVKWEKLTDCLAVYDDKDKKDIWEYLLTDNRTELTWNNYLVYRNLFGLTSTLVEILDANIDTMLVSEGQEELTDEIIKELFIEDISDACFKKLISIYKVDKFTNQCSEFTREKLGILIHEHYFDFIPERYIELKEISIELSHEFIKENKTEFLSVIDSCNLSIEDIKDVIKLGILCEVELLILFDYFTPSDIDDTMAILISGFDFLIPKSYTEAVWKILKNEDKFGLLYKQMDTYDLDEIAEKFGELGGDYKQFSDRTKHKFVLYPTRFNYNLCKKLQSKDFISSWEETDEKVGNDIITSADKYEKRITGYVKKKSEKY